MDRKVGLVLDPVFERHRTGEGHPESPQRLTVLRSHFEDSGLVKRCRRSEPAPISPAALTRVHDAAYLEQVENAVAAGASALDTDTAICKESLDVARLAAGSVVELCRHVADGGMDAGFAAVRPPGHHAEWDRAMGFCIYNNVAVAAASLLERQDVNRVLVVDWDVHHGNGTQHIFENDDRVFYFSVHQSPLYPGTGSAEETGTGRGAGYTLNRPLPPGSGDNRFLEALETGLVPAADRFAPDFVLLSAGFDAHRSDPLAGLSVTTSGFGDATETVRAIADRHAGGRLVSVLEGGYDLRAMPESAAAHVERLLRT
jgi:acetoin utilization deacetylase AcuC-like enzyme